MHPAPPSPPACAEGAPWVAGPERFRSADLAVVARDAALTYGELHARAADVAERLRGLGIAPGDLVALCVERSAALIVAAVAIREVGAAYVALDPVHPDRRLQETLVESGISAAVFGDGIAARLGFTPSEAATGLELVTVRGRGDRIPDAAYVVYTSGSTGTPKGVVATQTGLANLVSWHLRAFSLTSVDRCTQIAAPGFDAFAWEIWPSLAAGASIHVAPEELKTDPAALRDWLLAEQITVCFLPTPLAEAVIALDWPSAAGLRLLLTGGDRMHRRPPEGLPFTVVNNYGVSEASVVSTSGVVAPGPDDVVLTIGAPIDNVEVRIVDDQLQPVPAGAPGELLLGGVCLARGYLDQPWLTAQRFVSDPYDDAGTRWYRTGDLVRRLPDGDLVYLGRIDDQVQIRGNRVEPGEVAAVVERHAAVGRCVVAPVPDASGDVTLVAYARPVTTEPPPPDKIRAFLAQRLPIAMIPADIVWVDAFPVTANGKIDVAALSVPVRDIPETRGIADETEAAVADLVAEVLDVPHVIPDDNFILLGGDSLLAARLLVLIADRFDAELPLRTVFEHPTVIELAAEVRRVCAGG